MESKPAVIPFVKNHPALMVSIIAILITLSLYAYFLGVLDRFQLEPSLFPLSIERAYQLGIAFLVRSDWFVLLIALFIIVIVFTLFFSLIFLGVVCLVNRLQKLLTDKFPSLAKNSSSIIIPEATTFAILTTLGIIISLVMFYHLGKYKSVNREIVDYSSTIKMKGENGVLYEDVGLILCGQFCAIHIKEESGKDENATIILIPASDIEYIKQDLSNG